MRKITILLSCAKSLMYNNSPMRNSGPMIKPFGTPVVVDSIFDLMLLISMHFYEFWVAAE